MPPQSSLTLRPCEAVLPAGVCALPLSCGASRVCAGRAPETGPSSSMGVAVRARLSQPPSSGTRPAAVRVQVSIATSSMLSAAFRKACMQQHSMGFGERSGTSFMPGSLQACARLDDAARVTKCMPACQQGAHSHC